MLLDGYEMLRTDDLGTINLHFLRSPWGLFTEILDGGFLLSQIFFLKGYSNFTREDLQSEDIQKGEEFEPTFYMKGDIVEMDGDGSTDTVAEVSLLEPGDVIFE